MTRGVWLNLIAKEGNNNDVKVIKSYEYITKYITKSLKYIFPESCVKYKLFYTLNYTLIKAIVNHKYLYMLFAHTLK